MAENQEEEFKKKLWSLGYKIEDAAEFFKMSRQTVYNNIRKPVWTKEFTEKVDELFKQKGKSNELKEPNEEYGEIYRLKKELEEAKAHIIDLRYSIQVQEELLETYRKRLHTLPKDKQG